MYIHPSAGSQMKQTEIHFKQQDTAILTFQQVEGLS